jgi:hypothetical protein
MRRRAVGILPWIRLHNGQTFHKRNWAGRGVIPALRGVSTAQAHWRPHPKQHTIAEITLHMAYWKDAVTAHLRRQPWKYDETLNWRSVPPTKRGWVNAQAELRGAHRRLMGSLRTISPARLWQPIRPQHPDRLIDLAVGIATHDSYHAAQIFVLRRLSKRGK